MMLMLIGMVMLMLMLIKGMRKMKTMVLSQVDKSLHIKGQMNFMPDWNVVMFLGSPAIANLEQLQVVLTMMTLSIPCRFRFESNFEPTPPHCPWH